MNPLTQDQQRLAEEALELLPVCLADFRRRYPCFRAIAEQADLEGAAMLAITRAARTYDPEKAGISAYFSQAIRFACLREIEREIKTNAHSQYRISYEAAEQRQPPEAKPLADPLLTAIQNLSEEERRIIEQKVFDKTSIRAFAREWGVSTRKAKARINCTLDSLAECWREAVHR